MQLSGSVHRLQIDNQMLAAVHPVVLAPASVASSATRPAASSARQRTATMGADGGPLITFEMVSLSGRGWKP